MARVAMIRARTENQLKKEAERIFKKLGLTASAAINLFYKQVLLHKGLPFEVVLPNETTIKTFEDTDAGRNLIEAESTEDMFKKLEI
jgi:DNA-damage-inducible protein J